MLADIPITFSEWNIANPSIGGFVTTANTGTLEVLLHLTQGAGQPGLDIVRIGEPGRRRWPGHCAQHHGSAPAASLPADRHHPARRRGQRRYCSGAPIGPVGAATAPFQVHRLLCHGRNGYGLRVIARQLPERIRDNRRPARSRWPQQVASSLVRGAASAQRMGPRAGVLGVGGRLWPLHRSADLRGGSRRLSAPGGKVRLHVPPVFLRSPEHEPPVHLSPIRRAALRAVAADVLQCRIGAGRLDDGQPDCTDRRARSFRAAGQALARQGGDLASRPGAHPARPAPQSGADHHRLRAGEPVRDVPRHVGPPQRAPHRQAPAAAGDRHRVGRGGEAHSAAVPSLSGADPTLACAR